MEKHITTSFSGQSKSWVLILKSLRGMVVHKREVI